MPDQTPADEEAQFGDPIPDVFPPDDPAARFVVAMSMANNDVDRAFRDLLRSGDEDRPDFSYRIRVVAGYLYEAVDALSRYSKQFPEVKALLAQLPPDAQNDLKTVRGTLQKAGRKTLAGVRKNTFHYPSPNGDYAPDSDEQLRDALTGMAKRGTVFHVDGDTGAITLTFADDAAFGLAFGDATDQEVVKLSESARDGALAFVRLATRLVRTYADARGHSFGDPLITDKKKSTNRRDQASDDEVS